jgi:hypothetical protein
MKTDGQLQVAQVLRTISTSRDNPFQQQESWLGIVLWFDRVQNLVNLTERPCSESDLDVFVIGVVNPAVAFIL